MNEFVSAAIGFPAVIFGAALVVIVCFWLLVLVGAAGHDSFDADLDTGPAGLGGVPVSVSVSLLIVFAWFGSLTGTVLLRHSDTGSTSRAVLSVAVFAGSLLLAWGAVRLLVRRFRSWFPAQPPPSRLDFVGSVCTIRTGTVTATFGQAEVLSRDGSTAIVQVRQAESLPPPSRAPRPGAEDAPLVMGGTGLLYAYDADGEFFWVSSYDTALDPGPNG
ncbi:hypothetical protein AB0935_08395 [Streptomyces sp. NPDC007027]|uniref:hypothetical protein n=1 Tax=unclassified Streptomyces TaxID=2593676 RepID=UPI00345237FB